MRRPWSELRPIQVIMQKASGALVLQWPPGTPTLYKHLAQVGQQLLGPCCNKSPALVTHTAADWDTHSKQLLLCAG